MDKVLNDKILKELTRLGGQQFQEDAIDRHDGGKIMLPTQMTTKAAIEVLETFQAAQAQTHTFERRYNYRTLDGAVALMRAIRVLTGMDVLQRPSMGFFGPQPPVTRTVQIGRDETMQVAWGEISLPLLEANVSTSAWYHEDFGELFHLIVSCPKKYASQVEGLFRLVENQLETASIYRGKAFDGAAEPGFIDPDSVNSQPVIYTEATVDLLESNLWSMLRHTDAFREANLPLKRAVLLHGPYGTGKSLAALKTAQAAVENGWTFILCRTGRDDLSTVMSTAQLYQPSVVFFEDVDSLADGSRVGGEAITRLLDTFDGITAKGTELVVVLTTNHPDRIHKGMLRPGRLDAVIEIGGLDQDAIEKLIKAVVPEGSLDPKVDYEAVGIAMDGFTPAFIKEAVDRTKRFVIARTGTLDGEVLVTSDFVRAAASLQGQLDLMTGANEATAAPTVDMLLGRRVIEAVDGMAIVRTDEGELEIAAPNSKLTK